MKTFTVNDIRSPKAYNPTFNLPEKWVGTAVDVLSIGTMPMGQRLKIVINSGDISNRTLRLFAAWCYRQTLDLITNPDPRSIKAVEIAEAYANGKATKEELSEAYSEACFAARSVMLDTVATGTEVYSAQAAADATMDSDVYAALYAAEASAVSQGKLLVRWTYAPRMAQIAKLIEMINAENI